MVEQKKLALIHIIKRELRLSDEEYRRILMDAAGVSSARDLDEEKFRRLMNYFVRSRHYREQKDGITLRQKMFIQDMVRELGWDEDHTRNFIRKYYGKENLFQLTKREAMKCIEALKHIRR